MMDVSADTSANNTSSSYMPYSVPSRVEGITVSVFFLLEAVLIIAGNCLTIGLFAKEKKLRKKSLLLVVNMAFADLIIGAVSHPLYVYVYIGPMYLLWKWDTSHVLRIGWLVIDMTLSQASLISAVCIACERFYAIFRPLKHRTLSLKAYFFIIVIVWTLALLVSAVYNAISILISPKAAVYPTISFVLLFLFIICLCNIGIYRTFHKRKVSSHQGNRASQTQRLTITLLLVSTVSLLSWLPLGTVNYIFHVKNITIPKQSLIYNIIIIVCYSNFFLNSVVYSLRIPEFRQSLVLCFTRRRTVINGSEHEGRYNKGFALTTGIEPSLTRNLRYLQQDLALECEDSKL